VAVTLPFICGYNAQVRDVDCNDGCGAAHVLNVFHKLRVIIGEHDLESALRTLIQRIGFDLNLAAGERGVDFDIDRILNYVNNQRMMNNRRMVIFKN
jgi:hypothetical protein